MAAVALMRRLSANFVAHLNIYSKFCSFLMVHPEPARMSAYEIEIFVFFELCPIKFLSLDFFLSLDLFLHLWPNLSLTSSHNPGLILLFIFF
jgi:hypothetical protein